MNDTTEVSEYRLHYRGLYGRNRTPKSGTIMLEDVESGHEIQNLEAKVAEKLSSIKAKPGLTWRVTRQNVQIEINRYNDTIFTSRLSTLFDDVVVMEGTVAPS